MEGPTTGEERRPVRFCVSNVDLHSLEEFSELQSLGVNVEESHCLGLCHHCSDNKVAVCDDQLIVAGTAPEFWSAIRGHLRRDTPTPPQRRIR